MTTWHSEKKSVVIFGGGRFSDKALEHFCRKDVLMPGGIAELDFITICVDGGLSHFEESASSVIKKGYPDVIVGDFDTYPGDASEVKNRYPASRVVRLDAVKDFTDMEAAVDIAVEYEAEQILILGATGSRLDHTTANILLLGKIEREGVRAVLIDEFNIVFPISTEGKKYELPHIDDYYMSVISLSERLEGVNMRGVEYEVEGGVLERISTMGVSNRVNSKKPTISFKKGCGLVIFAVDD